MRISWLAFVVVVVLAFLHAERSVSDDGFTSWVQPKKIGKIKNEEAFRQFVRKLPSQPVSGQQVGRHHGLEDFVINHDDGALMLTGIADGHLGDDTARHIASKAGLFKHIQARREAITPESIQQAFFDLNEDTKQWRAGSTLSMLASLKDQPWIVGAHIADSPIVFVMENGDLYRTTDHDGDNAEEMSRLHQAYIEQGKYLAWHPKVTKDFGRQGQNAAFKPVPDVFRFEKKDVAFALVLSDGITDAFKAKQGTKNEGGMVDDFIQKALVQSPGDKYFSAKEIKRLAQIYAGDHADDMSILMQKFNGSINAASYDESETIRSSMPLYMKISYFLAKFLKST